MLAGFIQDILLAWYYLEVSEKKPVSSSLLAFVTTITSYTIFYKLILSPAFMFNLLCYAIGGGIGTFAIVYLRKHRKIKL